MIDARKYKRKDGGGHLIKNRTQETRDGKGTREVHLFVHLIVCKETKIITLEKSPQKITSTMH